MEYALHFANGISSFPNAKETYRPGECVRIYYPFVATDTRYSFFVDDVSITPSFSPDKGFILEFMMPDHDATIRIEAENIMLFDPDEKTE